MSRKIRTGIYISLSLISIGLVTTVLGIAFGGSLEFQGFWETRYLMDTINHTDKDIIYITDAQKEYTRLEAFGEIDAEIESLNFIIETGDEFAIDITNHSRGKVEYEVEDGTLVVRHEGRSKVMKNPNGSIRISLPPEVKLDNVVLNNGVGETDIRDIQVSTMEIGLGVGEVELTNVEVDALEIAGGIGSITAKQLVSYGTTIDVGVGEVELQGSFLGDVDIAGGMGMLDISTTAEYKDYNYYITKGLGEIEINDTQYNVFENIEKNNKAPYTMIIEGGIGEININTN